ncbi:UNVERIFIED_CONTAM: hypothetical protein GTU68_045563 [Idotea baltica]|nr:hypothetical protein [Idotea baltica]
MFLKVKLSKKPELAKGF